jgi:hypothetical protein
MVKYENNRNIRKDLFRNALTDVTDDLPELAHTVSPEETRDRHADTDGFRPRFALCIISTKAAGLFNELLGLKLFI